RDHRLADPARRSSLQTGERGRGVGSRGRVRNASRAAGRGLGARAHHLPVRGRAVLRECGATGRRRHFARRSRRATSVVRSSCRRDRRRRLHRRPSARRTGGGARQKEHRVRRRRRQPSAATRTRSLRRNGQDRVGPRVRQPRIGAFGLPFHSQRPDGRRAMSIREDATTPKKVDHLTVEERAARGKAARGDIARGALGEWSPAPGRRDPIDILEEQARTRVPELVPIRYGRMLVSPFAFYRGAAAVMAADLAQSPRPGLRAQLCGDAHLSNFGAFAAPDRRLIFGVNDFDETLPGPFEWDVKRLVASFAVAARELGFAPKVRQTVTSTAAQSYRESMQTFAAERNMDLWYERIDVETDLLNMTSQATAKERKRAERSVAKARTKDSLKAFAKLTQV